MISRRAARRVAAALASVSLGSGLAGSLRRRCLRLSGKSELAGDGLGVRGRLALMFGATLPHGFPEGGLW